MYVCLCADKKLDEIRSAIRNGKTTINELKIELGVCTGCGTCERMVEKIIADEH
tara:strand:+ start:723 stop:884 length:162 start_codon:yes stop_codon:yes gene_type:complete